MIALRGVVALVLLPFAVLTAVLVRQGDRLLSAYDAMLPESWPRPTDAVLTLFDQLLTFAAGAVVGFTAWFWVWN